MADEQSIAWIVPEHHEHQRSRRWYIIALAVLGLLVLYALLSANFLFAIILIVVAITMAMHDKNGAPEVACEINDDGVRLGRQLYEYGGFKNFWIYYEPNEAKQLFLEFKSGMRPRLAIPLLNKNPLKIRAILLQYLPEDIERENEPFSEQVIRLLKL